MSSRDRSAQTMIARRETRSATTPPSSRLATSAAERAARTIPMSDAEPPIPITANASATLTMRSPNHEIAAAPSRRRNAPSRSTSRLSGKRGTTPQA